MMASAGCLILSIFAAWLLVKPFTLENYAQAQEETGDRTRLIDHKQSCVQILKDLELDFATGKIGREDYNHMKAATSGELAAVLKRIETG